MGLFETLTLEGAGQFSSYSAQVMSVSAILGGSGMWSDLLGDIGEYFIDKIERNYDTAGGEVGGFVRLTQPYADREKGGDTTPDLQLTGEYRAAWAVDDYGENAIIIHNPDFEDSKHLWHEFGTVKMPMRPVLNLLDEDLERIDEMFATTFDAQVFRRL